MNIWHKRFLWVQIAVLAAMAVLANFQNLSLWWFLGVFALEVGILEAQRKENPEAVLYRKSCLFALADLISVGLFIGFAIIAIWQPMPSWWFTVLFSYIILRKIYIYQNYSYQKI